MHSTFWIIEICVCITAGYTASIKFQSKEANMKANVTVLCTAEDKLLSRVNIQDRNGTILSDSGDIVNRTTFSLSAVVYSNYKAFREIICYAFDDNGNITLKTINITYIEPPRYNFVPTVGHIKSSNIGLKWNSWTYTTNSGGKSDDKIQYKIVYRNKGSLNWSFPKRWISSTEGSISGLAANTFYEIAIMCRREGSGGEGEPGPTILVKTACSYPTIDSAPINFTVLEMTRINATVTNVTLKWEQPLNSGLRCDIVNYVLKYRSVTQADMELEINPKLTTISLTTLAPGTVYVFQIYARTPKTAGTTGKLTIRTLDPLLTPVENLKVETLSDLTKVNIMWKPYEFQHIHYPINYRVIIFLQQLMECPKNSLKVFDFYIQNITTNIEVKPLLPYSIYLIQVEALTNIGTSKPAEAIHITFQSEPEDSPHNITVTQVGTTYINFKWDPLLCNKTNGQIIKYEYMLNSQQHKKRSINQEFYSFLETNHTSINITELIPFHSYYFSVRAVNIAGAGPISPTLFVKTKESIPLVATTLKIVDRNMDSLSVQWQEPSPAHAKTSSYNLQYGISTNDSDITTIIIFNSEDTLVWNAVIQHLKPVTKYSIQVQACGKIGCSNWSTTFYGITKEGYPTAPVLLKLLRATSNSLEITWQPPDITNGNITEYKATYYPIYTDDDKFNISESKSIIAIHKTDHTNPTLIFMYKRLHTVTLYNFSVQASTVKGYGASVSGQFWTKLQVPDSPLSPIVDYLEITDSTVSVTIVPLPNREGPIKFYQLIVCYALYNFSLQEDSLYNYTEALQNHLTYYITAQLSSQIFTKIRIFEIGDGNMYDGYYNAPLNKDAEIYIYIRVISMGNGETATSISRITKPVIVQGVSADTFASSHFLPKSFLLIIILVCVIVVLIIIIIIITVVAIRRCHRNDLRHVSLKSDSIMWSVAYKYSEDGAEDVVFPDVKPGTLKQNKRKLSLRARKASLHGAVRVEEFVEHVSKLKSNAASGFMEEYREILNSQTPAPWTVGKRAVNQRKNRFGNIIAYDHSRVVLNSQINVPNADYINASYIDGYDKPNIYIATQGPLENTVIDFWRMIWQERSVTIVMLTQLIEDSKVKCDQYWTDSDNAATYGEFKIALNNVENNSDYIVRTFLVRKSTTNEQRKIKQYQYLQWPAKRVPQNISSLLKMRNQIKNENPPNKGPIIVHCSGGVGRVGSFITLDAMLEQMDHNGYVEIFNYVTKIRTQRINMIQTLDQYIFVHDAILEVINNLITLVPGYNLRGYYNKISLSANGKTSELEDQFQKVSLALPLDPFRCCAALSQENRPKNRSEEIVPTDERRVILHIPYKNHSDYVCATYIDSFIQKRNIFVTIHPLPHTVIDFWRMVADYKLSIIIMLNAVDSSDESCVSYWPSNGVNDYGSFRVEVVTFEDHGPFVKRIMRLSNTSKSNDDFLTVVHFQFTDWPDNDTVPNSPLSVMKLMSQVRYWQKKIGCTSFVIHCMDGAVRSGVFCAANIISEKLMVEKSVDIFQMVKRLKQQRPEMISNLEQYRFCYQMALAYLEEFHAYSFCA